MRYQGKLSNWKDEKGFGFIAPDGGGRQVFVHVKAFSNRQRRPVGGEAVTYELKTDNKGRLRADRVVFAGKRVPLVKASGHSNVSIILAVTFLVFVAGSVYAGRLPIAVLWLYLIAGVVAFAAYAFDKSAARNDRWRVRESTLHLFALAGGWPGALVAQRIVRHKTKKRSFQVVFWTTAVVNCSALGWLFSSSGSEALRSVLGAW